MKSSKSITLDNMILQTRLPDGQEDNKMLRVSAERVTDIKSADIKTLINKMAEAMFNEPDGIGIAAPQIGESLQIFLVAKDLLNHPAEERENLTPSPPLLRKERGLGERLSLPPYEGGRVGLGVKERQRKYLVFINPVIKKLSQKKSKDIEGCLSVRGVYGEVTRPEKLTIEYFDELDKKHTRGASGLLARVIQHEVDHLNGILFIDKAKNIKKL